MTEIEEIGAGYALQRMGEGVDRTDSTAGEVVEVMRAIGGEYLPIRRFVGSTAEADAREYISVQVMAKEGQ